MASTVKLNGYSFFGAVKIQNIRPNTVLPTKFSTGKLTTF